MTSDLEKQRARVRRSYWRHRKERNVKAKLWREQNPEKMKLARQRWNAKNPDKLVEHAFRSQLKKYGLAEETYTELLTKQKNVCAICNEPCSVWSRLSVDHDHQTGKVRGLLCNHCNSGLGKFMHLPERLRAAADYLSGNHTPITVTIDPFTSRILE